MKGDGYNGGEKFVGERGTISQQKTSTRNRKFTMIGLTSFDGEPVMCVLILEGKLPNGSIEAGIDITVHPDGTTTDSDFIIKNCGKGKYFPGGPECVYRGKTVPALVRWHESGSITSNILVEMLQTLDEMDLIPREDNVKPFILLDGHGSRLELPFLKYVNTPEDHWVACIGVPYGTALWQVGDSKEQNGSFNMAMTKAKQDLVALKDSLGLQNEGIVDTDLMPLINRAWDKSFARVEKNKNAISDRGWNPLNKCLLLDQTLRSTMTAKESSEEYNRLNEIILPRTVNQTSDTDDSSIIDVTATNTDVDTDVTPNNLPTCDVLNFSTGMSQYCLKAYLSNEQLQQAREEIREDMNIGKSVKQVLKESARLSSGIVFKAGTSRLGKTVFDVYRENIIEKNQKQIEKIQKDESAYNEQVKKAREVLEKKLTIESMTIRELKIICKPLKRKEDGTMPNKRDELINKYREWSGRPPPSFDVSHLMDGHGSNESGSTNGADDTTMAVIDNHESQHTGNDESGYNESENNDIVPVAI